jgi:uncharacterized membrane protein YfcA
MWNSFDYKVAVAIFFLQIVIDSLYGYYVRTASNGRAAACATSGSLIHLIAVFQTISYVRNWLYIFPLAAGSWVGTYLIVRYDKKL